MRNTTLLLFGLLFLIGCKESDPNNEIPSSIEIQKKQIFDLGNVSADNTFDGARLNDFKKLNDSIYQAFINPENTPVNSSPWFSFRIWSKEPINISLEMIYPEGFKHRYIPKFSHDGNSWQAYDETTFEVDTSGRKMTMNVSLTSEKLWISAQELMTTSSLETWMNNLAEKPFIHKEEIGKSVNGQSLQMLRISENSPQNAFLIIGRQHPPEVPGGTISLKAFLETMLSDSELATAFREEFQVLAIPLLNPDGADLGHWRHNANGQDLNRDWQAFSQPETQAVRDWFENLQAEEKDLSFRFGIDFHTSHTGPYLLTLDTIPHQVKPEITHEWIAQLEALTGDTLDIRPRAQDLPYCYNWMINEGGMEAVTYEEGDEIDREIIRKRAADYANELMKILIAKYE